jgi:peptide/nickel transport system substrate-binding protein
MRKIYLLAMSLFAFLLFITSVMAAGGVLKIALTSNLNTLDPAKTKGGDEYLYMFMVFNGLTYIDRDMTLKPDLAEKWESSNDLKTWTFYLKKGVKFHHGKELISDDVKATVDRLLDKETGSVARINFLMIENVEAIDKYTIRFRLNIPYAGFPDLFAERQARIIPKDAIDRLTTSPFGTGPFKFVSYTPGDKLVLAKHTNYFEGAPPLDGIELRVVPESSSRITGLETGELHVVWSLPLEHIGRLKNNPDIVIDQVATSTWDALVMNNNQAPFDKMKVRQAINLAIDKNKIVEAVLYGYGSPTLSPIPPIHPFFNNTVPIKSDIEKAKKLLSEAGYPNGFEITLIVPADRPARERLGIVSREMLKDIGIKVNLQRVPWDKFLADIEGRAAFYIDGFFSRPTLDTSIYPWYHSEGSWNKKLWNYKNTKVDELLDTARKSSSLDEQKKAYFLFQEIVTNDPPSVVPYVVKHVDGFRKEVKGLHSSPMLYFDMRKVELAK